jgi:hypothetical protein
MSERNLVARLEAWAAWCHKRNLKAELQADIYAAAEEVERLQSVLRNIYTYNATGNYEVDYFLMKNMADRALKSLEDRLQMARTILKLEQEVERLREHPLPCRCGIHDCWNDGTCPACVELEKTMDTEDRL